MNIGVAAHVTGASRGGPRYDASLTSEQRASHENGIWLCQTCAKLVDSDVDCYTAAVLRQWKIEAEEAARRDVEHTHTHDARRDETFRRLERLMPELLAEMRSDMAAHPLAREVVAMPKGAVFNWGQGRTGLEYYREDHAEIENKLHILESSGLIRVLRREPYVVRFVLTEELADYLAAG